MPTSAAFPPTLIPFPGLEGFLVHILISVLYGAILWLSIVAYTLIVGGPAVWVLALGPVLISGFVALLITLDLVISWLVGRLAPPVRWMWRSLARRSRADPAG